MPSPSVHVPRVQIETSPLWDLWRRGRSTGAVPYTLSGVLRNKCRLARMVSGGLNTVAGKDGLQVGDSVLTLQLVCLLRAILVSLSCHLA